jgi:hypothetical protein
MNTSIAADRAPEIERYLAGVTAALADLPEKVRQELLDDLPDHLAEIAADDPAPLDSRLGSPPAYAAELRAAVGVDVTKHRHHADRWAEVVAQVRPHLRTFDERVGRLIGYDRLVDLLVQLRPAWWILRGYVVGMVLLSLFANGYDIFPQDSSAGLLGWLLVLVLVGVSIRIGRQPVHMMRRVGPRWVAAAVIAALFAAWSVSLLSGEESPNVYYGPGSGYENPTEVYVYTETGQPVTNVRVYNRDGAAVPIGVPMGCDQPDYGYSHERRGCIPRDDPDGDRTDDPEPSPQPSGTTGPGATTGPSASAVPSGSAVPSASPS